MTEPTLPFLPLVAILRGLEAERAADVAHVLFDAGFRIVEVPLNRPGALRRHRGHRAHRAARTRWWAAAPCSRRPTWTRCTRPAAG